MSAESMRVAELAARVAQLEEKEAKLLAAGDLLESQLLTVAKREYYSRLTVPERAAIRELLRFVYDTSTNEHAIVRIAANIVQGFLSRTEDTQKIEPTANKNDTSGQTPNDTDKPVAWGIAWSHDELDCEFVFDSPERARAEADDDNGSIIPLYRQPQPVLTDAERKAISSAISALKWHVAWESEEDNILRELLKRTKPTTSTENKT